MVCNHKWVFQRTDYSYFICSNIYYKIDTYYCEKCLVTKEVDSKKEWSICKPYWFHG